MVISRSKFGRWCLALLAWGLGPGLAHAEDLGAYQVIKGQLSQKAGAWVAGAEGARVVYPAGLQLDLSPGTAFKRFGAQPVWFASRGKTLAQLFEVETGHLVVNVKSVGGKVVPAVFRTDHNLTGVCLEGQLAIDVGEQARVANLEGSAEVRQGTKWQDLPNGSILFTERGFPRPHERTAISPPRWLGAQRAWAGFKGPAHVGGFRWTTVSGAQAYRVRILDASRTQTLFERDSERAELATNAVDLEPGSYWASVRAIDEFGFPGQPSAPLKFQVIGFVPSRDSYLDNSGIARVGNDGILTFSNTEGLEMTYGSVDGWIEAPPQVYLRRDERTLIGFRYPGDLDVVTVPALAQSVSADVEIGPPNPVWPGPKVALVVRLRDASGGLDAERVKPHIVTRIGLKPIALAWQREGNTLRAELPPQSGNGPWVVRVSVLHPLGDELGRGVLEINGKEVFARPPPSPPPIVSRPQVALDDSRD